MTIELQDGVLHCAGTLAVEDAEQLLGHLLQIHAAADRIEVVTDLGACEHLHAACLQVLMAGQVKVAQWPDNPALSAWLQAALAQHGLDRN